MTASSVERIRTTDEDTASSSSALYTWPISSSVGSHLHCYSSLRGITIAKVSLSAGHVAILSVDGRLFTHGSDDYGQLGHDVGDLSTPRHVEALTGHVTDVGCGHRHTAAVCDGAIYCWGQSTSGQCGCLSDRNPLPTPVMFSSSSPSLADDVPADNEDWFSAVDCGEDFSVGLSRNGVLWVWGGTIGAQPCRIDYLHGRRVLDIACGAHHTLVLVEQTNRFSASSNSHHALPDTCHGSPDRHRHASAMPHMSHALLDKYRGSMNIGHGSENTSRGASPVEDGVQRHRTRPSTCVHCQNEIYTYTETADTCVINDVHKCPLGLDIITDHPADYMTARLPSFIQDSGRQISTSRKRVQKTATLQSADKDSGRNKVDSPQHSVQDLSSSVTDVSHTMRCAQSLEEIGKLETGAVEQDHCPEENQQMASNAIGILNEEKHESGSEEKDMRGTVGHADVSNCKSSLNVNDEVSTDLALGISEVIDHESKSGENMGSHGDGDTESCQISTTAAGDALVNSNPDVVPNVVLAPVRSNITQPTSATSSLLTLSNDLPVLPVNDIADSTVSSHAVATVDLTSSTNSAVTPTEHDPSSHCSLGVRSRSSFIDETEAKNYLEKQLYGDNDTHCDRDEVKGTDVQPCVTAPASPFVKNLQQNLLQFVPSPPAVVSDTVSSWTRSVVSNIRTSIDRFAFVTPDDSSDASVVDGDNTSDAASVDSVSLPVIQPLTAEIEPEKDVLNNMRKSSSEIELEQSETVVSVDYTPLDLSITTEVWSFGSGQYGQLGHGDLLDRLHPCLIATFNGLGVTRIAAGDNHSLALTTKCQVYSWGSNSHGQLGYSGSQSATPQRVKILGGNSIWDIAAGEGHSVLLADGLGFTSDVYSCGTQTGQSAGSPLHQNSQLISLAPLRKVGRIRRLEAGGHRCACVTKRHTDAFLTLHEFATTERHFFIRLERIYDTFLRTLLTCSEVDVMEKSMFWHPLQVVFDAFKQLMDAVALNHVELTHVIRNDMGVQQVAALSNPESLLNAFSGYSQCLSDAVAFGAVQYCTKTASTFFEDAKDSFTKVLEMKNVDFDDIALTFQRILRVPFSRVSEYTKLLEKLSLCCPMMSERLHCTSQCWDNFRQSEAGQHKSALNTKAFWENCSSKTVDALKSVGRRLIRESRSHPISIHLAGRFSSHAFFLFNDIFVHNHSSVYQIYPLITIWAEAVPSSDTYKNAIRLTTPEDQLTLAAPSASDKTEWLCCILQGIETALSIQKSAGRSSHLPEGLPRGGANKKGKRSEVMLRPPRHRHAFHVFTKHPLYRDAKYEGMWKDGRLHGSGVMRWSDGRHYVGRFKDGEQDGYGVYTVVKGDGAEIYDGHWKSGKMHGLGHMVYANGDVYEGNFSEGRRHGHGVMKQGKLTAGLASIYVGEWANDKKSGFGVLDDILKGQKYMGLWQDGSFHGNGVIVTLDGLYFEGQFVQNKMAGCGLLLTEDNTSYEGEFAGGSNLYGKGTLTLPNGDYIEGHFNGSFSEGIKVTGTFRKAMEPVNENHGFTHSPFPLPKSYGKHAVKADTKWAAIFSHCYCMLGSDDEIGEKKRLVAWERVASALAVGRKNAKTTNSDICSRLPTCIADDLAVIPSQGEAVFSIECWTRIQEYIQKAFDTPLHPLGWLMSSLVDVYRVTYVGVGAHPRLLRHAVDEVVSYVSRIYPILRILFPILPTEDLAGDAIEVYSEAFLSSGGTDRDDSGESTYELFSVAGLIHPLLLPKIYPPLFDLYALYNERDDEAYWKRVLQWNKQADVALMAYLGVQQQFWLLDESTSPKQRLSTIKDQSYTEATDTLQRLSTSFSPAQKLTQIQATFHEINKLVQTRLGRDHLWCMDDLFPVFLYVVVRARIQHLGAEIHFIDDLMQKHLQYGELGLMFTTLKACYFQIQHEKII